MTRFWLILIGCGFAGVPSMAEVPDPGLIAMASTPPSLRAVDESTGDKANLAVEVKVTPPMAAVAALVAKPVDGAKIAAASVAAPAPIPAAVPAPDNSSEVVPDDGGISDTFNKRPAKAAPDVPEAGLGAFAHIDYLRKHNDVTMAISYLREVVTNQNILPQDRARAMVELADALEAGHQEAEALCWLKLWMQLYPGRSELGAVAFRVGTIYTHMGLSDLARDAYYLTLAHTVNDGRVQSEEDLKQYTRLTVGTLWALAANEYEAGQWSRAAELLGRYRVEATTGSAISMGKAAFLQADCYYQLKQADKATGLYEETLQKYPFNTLAPEARLRLYHLYVIKNEPEKAKEELEALAWTVRTVWPKQETYWQKQTAELLLALNQKNTDVLPPLFQESAKLSPEGKSWQDALNHYDTLVGYQAVTTQGIVDKQVRHRLHEEDDLLAMNKTMNQLLPSPGTASIP
jgi:tetratricopeptide (TPR) repeat protein